MNLLPSSTSNSEPTLQAIPRPLPAAYIALVTIVCFGALLSYLGGGMFGEPPKRTVDGLVVEAYRYRAKNRPAEDEILLLGNSLLLHGVLEDELRERVGKPDVNVMALSMAGSTIKDLGRLVARLDPSRATRHRIAVIQIHRWQFTGRRKSYSVGWRASIWNKLANWKPTETPIHVLDRAVQWIPERHDLTGDEGWIAHVKYDLFARHFPNLVQVPSMRPRELWFADDSMRARMTAGLKPVEYVQDFKDGVFAKDSLSDVRSLVAELNAKLYRVVLLLPPFHGEFFTTLAQDASRARLEDQFRSTLRDRSLSGADAVIEFHDARALGADDSIFFDYGHMTPEGASLFTRRLADALLMTGFLDQD
jgi:hypothetical protein